MNYIKSKYNKQTLLKYKQRIVSFIYRKYESNYLPPQNITLLDLKKKEFKEKTKYLDLKILYNLTKEEKESLKSQGYFVDLSESTIKEIKNFKLTSDRHKNRYYTFDNNYNLTLYCNEYYHDQNLNYVLGDPEYHNKISRPRTQIRRTLFFLSINAFIFFIMYHINSRHIRSKREDNFVF